MKKLILLLLFIPLVSLGQNKVGVELCLAAQELSKSFITDEEAENALDKILSVIGASKNFTLKQCDDINNALAITYKGNRYILYDKNFMKLINDYTDDWSSLFILAHEVGHHINGHTRDAALSKIFDETSLEKQRQEELEADKFAGFVLAKLGASLDQTVAAVNLVSTNKDDLYSTHPNKNKRLEAINFGYNSSLPKIADKETSIDESESKTTITKSSSGWQYIENNISEKFEERKIEKEVLSFGKIMPNTANNLNKNPKISIKKTPYKKKVHTKFRGRTSYQDIFFMTISNINIPIKENYILKIDDNWEKMNFNVRKEVFKYLNQYSFESAILPFEEKSNHSEYNEKTGKAANRGYQRYSATIEFSNPLLKNKTYLTEFDIYKRDDETSQSLQQFGGLFSMNYWIYPKDESIATFTINNNNIESISFYIPTEFEGYDNYGNKVEKISWLLAFDKLDIKIKPIIYTIGIGYSDLNNFDSYSYFYFSRDIENPNEYLSFDLSGLDQDLINLIY